MIWSSRRGQSLHAEPLRPGDAPSAGTSLGEDLMAGLLGLLIVTAVYLDGRAHVLELPDSFFTPWHAFLYSGLLLLTAWLALISRRAAIRQASRRPFVIPAGYGAAVTGALLFGFGGGTDMVWHQAFGIEEGIEGLLSPAHLLLFVSGTMMISGPACAARHRAAATSLWERLPATIGVLGMTSTTAFALVFASGFITDAPSFALAHGHGSNEAHFMAERLAEEGLASYVVTSLVLVIPLTYLVRSRLFWPGAVTVVVSSIAFLAALIEDFANIATVIAAVIAGVLTDAALLVVRRAALPVRGEELVLAALLPLLLWPGQLVALNMVREVLWPLELVTGVAVLCALVCFGIVLVLAAEPRRSPA
jgi:hypothetical protein